MKEFVKMDYKGYGGLGTRPYIAEANENKE